jgi:hypothetical protein
MSLSITTTGTFAVSLPTLGRYGAQRDPDRQDSEQPPTLASTSDGETTTTESASQRPAREPQESSGLTEEEQRQLLELQQRDREVKAHELAHKSVGGRYVTGGSFTYQTGPDGHRYAIGGEVSIDSSQESTPEETLRKAELIRRAALAPTDPSPQDYRVASQASLMATEARAEISAEQRQEIVEAREASALEEEEERSENSAVTTNRQGQRAIASFEAIGGINQLQSNPDPIDELI